MATTWNNTAGGNFIDGANWDSGQTPGSDDDVVIGVAGTYTVTLTSAATIASLNIDNLTATLAVDAPGDTFTVKGALGNGGVLAIDSLGDSHGSAVVVDGDLTNTGTLDLDNAYSSGGSEVTVHGALINQGDAYFGSAGGDLAAATTVSLGGLDNTGLIDINGAAAEGGPRMTVDAGATAAPSTLTGVFQLAGDAELIYASGAITGIGAAGELDLKGDQASVDVVGGTGPDSALALAGNAGTLNIDGGASYEASGDFSNSGVLGVDSKYYADGGSKFTVDGDLANTSAGQIAVDINYQVGASTFKVVGAFDNAGHFSVGETGQTVGSETVEFGSLQNTGTFQMGGSDDYVTTVTVAGAAVDSSYLTIGPHAYLLAQSMDIAAGGTLYLSGGTLSAPTTVESRGLLDVSAGSIAPDATILTGGAELVESGGSADGATIDGGKFEIAAGGAVADANITFLGTGGSLRIDGAAMPTNTIDGFVHAGNFIELTGVAFDSASPQPILLNDATHHNVLDVQESGDDYLLQLDPTKDYSGVAFSAMQNPEATGTEIANCYVTGTLILAAEGEIAVERLAIGDLVVTASGETRPVKWIGRRRLNCRRQADPSLVWPYRVLAGAFGPGAPHSDLWLSPDHCIAVETGEGEKVFMAVSALANGATIAQAPRDEVTYLHVELESHDVLLANGLPAESYLDCGARGNFDNAGAATTLRPRFAPPDGAGFCLPLASEGPLVAAVRRRLRDRCEALGWRQVGRVAELRLVIDGREERLTGGSELRFRVPADARDVRLRSTTFAPWHFADALSDRRPLGVVIRGVAVADGEGAPREIAIDDPLLRDGFYATEGEGAGAYRWTNGEARLPPALWAGSGSSPTFTVRFVGTTQKAWRREDLAIDRGHRLA